MSSKTVMIVDDEERLRALVRTYLEREGYRVLRRQRPRARCACPHQSPT